MRFFITLAYDGSPYNGWQVQPNGLSVQGLLQDALSTMLRRKTDIVGAGRTDSGVNARIMVAHFDCPEEEAYSYLESEAGLKQLTYRLNRFLPPTIYIYKVERVADDLHARFSAKQRTYRYYIHTRKDPFLRKFSHEIHYNLDFELMNEAASILKEHVDFGAFCKSHSDVKTTFCRIYEARWLKLPNNHSYCFEITADRFLRNMVRAIVGTLIDVGRGRLGLGDFDDIIRSGKRTEAGESMPAHALFLEAIKY